MRTQLVVKPGNGANFMMKFDAVVYEVYEDRAAKDWPAY